MGFLSQSKGQHSTAPQHISRNLRGDFAITQILTMRLFSPGSGMHEGPTADFCGSCEQSTHGDKQIATESARASVEF